MTSRFSDEQLLISNNAFLTPDEQAYKQFLIENQQRIEEYAASAREQEEQEKAEKLNHDALIFYPHDLEGKQVELDADAFRIIEAWGSVPGLLKKAMVAIVNLQGAA